MSIADEIIAGRLQPTVILPSTHTVLLIKNHQKDKNNPIFLQSGGSEVQTLSDVICAAMMGENEFAVQVLQKKFSEEEISKIKNKLIPILSKDAAFIQRTLDIINAESTDSAQSNGNENSDVKVASSAVTSSNTSTTSAQMNNSNGINVEIPKNIPAKGWFYISCYDSHGARRHLRLIKNTALGNYGDEYLIAVDSAIAVNRYATPFFKNINDLISFVNNLNNTTVRTKRNVNTYRYLAKVLKDGQFGIIKNASAFKYVHTPAGYCFISEFANS